MSQGFAEFFVGGAELFGVDAGFAYDGHEVGVAEPAREDVQVDVAEDAGACCAAQVDAEIESIGMVGGRQGGFDALGQRHHFGKRFDARAVQVWNVRVGNDHDVA